MTLVYILLGVCIGMVVIFALIATFSAIDERRRRTTEAPRYTIRGGAGGSAGEDGQPGQGPRGGAGGRGGG